MNVITKPIIKAGGIAKGFQTALDRLKKKQPTEQEYSIGTKERMTKLR